MALHSGYKADEHPNSTQLKHHSHLEFPDSPVIDQYKCNKAGREFAQWICRILTMIASWSEKDEVPTCAVQRNRIGSPSLQYAWSRQRPSWCVACGGLRRDLNPFSKSILLNA